MRLFENKVKSVVLFELSLIGRFSRKNTKMSNLAWKKAEINQVWLQGAEMNEIGLKWAKFIYQ